MPYYKNTDSELFWLDEGDDPTIWLPDCTQITDLEANSIRAAKEQAVIDSMNYAEKRASEYPSFADQFDLIYHNGIDAWKAVIQSVKDKYPKV